MASNKSAEALETRRRKATVVAVDLTTNTCSIKIVGDDTQHDGVPIMGGVLPQVNETVWCLQTDTDWLVLGRHTNDKLIWDHGLDNINAVSGQTESTTVINFHGTFAHTPDVVAVLGTTGPPNPLQLRVTARTTTTFTIGIRKADGTAFGANATFNAFWMAAD